MVRFSIEQPQARSAPSGPTSLLTEIPPPVTTQPPSPSPQIDLLQDASDKAVGAAAISQSAQSTYDWDAVAELLREAMTLAKAVPRGSSNYALAQKRLAEYQSHFADARQQELKLAPRPELTVARTTHTLSDAQPVAQEQLVSIVVPKTAGSHPPTPTTGVPPTGQVKTVVGQFFALDARLDVGLHYGEYGDRVAELRATLDRLGKQPGVAALPAYNSLKAALTNYETALDTWTFCINRHHCANDLPEAAALAGSSSPETAAVSSSNGAFFPGQLLPVADADSNWKDKSYLKTTISEIWIAAREQMEAAQHQL